MPLNLQQHMLRLCPTQTTFLEENSLPDVHLRTFYICAKYAISDRRMARARPKAASLAPAPPVKCAVSQKRGAGHLQLLPVVASSCQ